MRMRNPSAAEVRPALLELLEPRQLWSVSTTTTVTAPPASVVFGTTIDIPVHVKPSKGSVAPRGNVRLYLGKSAAIWNANLNSKGNATIVIDPGLTIYPGTYSLTVHYTPTGNFAASASKKKLPLTITLPKKLTTSSDGLEKQTIVAGKGEAVEAGHSITVKETGYTSAGVVDGETLTKKPASFTFTVQANPEQVIRGFDEGVLGMKVGETRVLEVPASLNTDDNQNLLFAVQLISINS